MAFRGVGQIAFAAQLAARAFHDIL
jgi:hypothetical protein